MGIHDGGEWQLKVKSWKMDKGRKVLGRKAREFLGRERNFWREELRAWWLVLLILFHCVRN
jgi:hypothetical protein